MEKERPDTNTSGAAGTGKARPGLPEIKRPDRDEYPKKYSVSQIRNPYG
jgi:hypothetical protein